MEPRATRRGRRTGRGGRAVSGGPGSRSGRTVPPGRRGGAASPFDRIGRPREVRTDTRDRLGKEALYSTAPTAAPTRPVDAHCGRCGVHLGLTVVEFARLLVPPFLVDPFRRRLWTRCPICDRYGWLELRTGQALRVLLDRDPRRR